MRVPPVVLLCACLWGCGSSMPASAGSSGSGTAGTSPSIGDGAAALPAQLKGYELYAWEEGGELSFTLVTGTNRLKSLDELRGAPVETQEGDWVLVRGRGLPPLEALLRRVPPSTSVLLSQHRELPALSADMRAEIEGLLPR